MQPQITLQIKLFGAFRQFQNRPVVLELPSGISVAEVKTALWEKLQEIKPGADLALLNASAIASSSSVLLPEMSLTESQSLAILPPVCGG
jgi:molybdopterin converting factor small subunit